MSASRRQNGRRGPFDRADTLTEALHVPNRLEERVIRKIQALVSENSHQQSQLAAELNFRKALEKQLSSCSLIAARANGQRQQALQSLSAAQALIKGLRHQNERLRLDNTCMRTVVLSATSKLEEELLELLNGSEGEAVDKEVASEAFVRVIRHINEESASLSPPSAYGQEASLFSGAAGAAGGPYPASPSQGPASSSSRAGTQRSLGQEFDNTFCTLPATAEEGFPVSSEDGSSAAQRLPASPGHRSPNASTISSPASASDLDSAAGHGGQGVTGHKPLERPDPKAVTLTPLETSPFGISPTPQLTEGEAALLGANGAAWLANSAKGLNSALLSTAPCEIVPAVDLLPGKSGGLPWLKGGSQLLPEGSEGSEGEEENLEGMVRTLISRGELDKLMASDSSGLPRQRRQSANRPHSAFQNPVYEPQRGEAGGSRGSPQGSHPRGYGSAAKPRRASSAAEQLSQRALEGGRAGTARDGEARRYSVLDPPHTKAEGRGSPKAASKAASSGVARAARSESVQELAAARLAAARTPAKGKLTRGVVSESDLADTSATGGTPTLNEETLARLTAVATSSSLAIGSPSPLLIGTGKQLSVNTGEFEPEAEEAAEAEEKPKQRSAFSRAMCLFRRNTPPASSPVSPRESTPATPKKMPSEEKPKRLRRLSGLIRG